MNGIMRVLGCSISWAWTSSLVVPATVLIGQPAGARHLAGIAAARQRWNCETDQKVLALAPEDADTWFNLGVREQHGKPGGTHRVHGYRLKRWIAPGTHGVGMPGWHSTAQRQRRLSKRWRCNR
jgi:hypothetical protein